MTLTTVLLLGFIIFLLSLSLLLILKSATILNKCFPQAGKMGPPLVGFLVLLCTLPAKVSGKFWTIRFDIFKD